MGTRVPVQHYNLRSANSYIGGSLHDLNTVDGRPGEIDGHVDRDTEDGLDNDEESSAVPSPAKFCDECGAPYLRETSKFCSECGVKRLGT
ncbi:uncharacterized protein At2g02148-like [Actinidia eriantha]|uniref:uncharacterized protein At2g02148-like n=1 Tax=Actinidia eriantha TaxID=165200 RepID=UPI00258D5CE6|nr:uncharacterized protein At2g02148-like [Actinidia eriantha]